MQEKSSSPWISVLQTGVIGGIIAVYICLVGMVEAFDKRDIVAGILRMGSATLLMAIFTISYFAVRKGGMTGKAQQMISGALAGLTASAFVAGLVLLSRAVNIRKVFVNASPVLFKTLTFSQKDKIGRAHV